MSEKPVKSEDGRQTNNHPVGAYRDTPRYNTPRPNRRSIRLPGYDYGRAGAYFVTICAQNRECLFGNVVDGQMALNGYGRLVSDSWAWLATQYGHIELDEYVIMPNHMHVVLIITDDCRGGSRTALRETFPDPWEGEK